MLNFYQALLWVFRWDPSSLLLRRWWGRLKDVNSGISEWHVVDVLLWIFTLTQVRGIGSIMSQMSSLTWNLFLYILISLTLNAIQEGKEAELISWQILGTVEDCVHLTLKGAMLAFICIPVFPHIAPAYVSASRIHDDMPSDQKHPSCAVFYSHELQESSRRSNLISWEIKPT